MRAHRRAALATGLTAVIALGAVPGERVAAAGTLLACGEEPPETPMYSAFVGGGMRNPRRGMSLFACTPESSLARITVRFSKGAAIRLKRRDEAYDFARYFIGANRDRGGTLQVPAGKAAGRFRLRFRPNEQTDPARVRAVLRTGRKPSLVISGLPADATELTLSTVGAGFWATRASWCRRDTVSYSGSMRIVLASGARDRGDASGGFDCGTLPRDRCTC